MSPTAISRALAENMLCFVQDWNSHRHSRRNRAVATTFIDRDPTTSNKSDAMLDFMGHIHAYTCFLASFSVLIFFLVSHFCECLKTFFHMHEFFSCSSSSPRVVSSLATPSHIAKSDHTKIRMLLYTNKFRIYWRSDHLRDDAWKGTKANQVLLLMLCHICSCLQRFHLPLR